MTYDDLLDSTAFDAGETSSEFRAASITWLNAVRNYIRLRGPWRCALREAVNVSTVSSTATVALVDGASVEYEAIYGRYIYDTTSDSPVTNESLMQGRATDPNQTVPGPPVAWSDAGINSAKQRLISLRPVPDAVYVLEFAGYLRLTTISSADTSLSEDPYYGSIINWSDTFLAGLRFYYDRNNNEDANQILFSRKDFDDLIRRQKLADGVTPSAVLSGRNNKTRTRNLVGRLDPAHYSN